MVVQLHKMYNVQTNIIIKPWITYSTSIVFNKAKNNLLNKVNTYQIFNPLKKNW